MRITVLFYSVIFILFCSSLCSQEIHDTYRETVPFVTDDKAVSIYNIYGSVTIEGYDGQDAIVEISKYIEARSKKGLDQAKEEVEINIENHEGAILVYIEDGNNYFDKKKSHYQSRHHNIRKTRYKYQYNITVKVPYDTDVAAYAINDGGLTIQDIDTDEIIASNLNGPIKLQNVSGAIDANALNEDIDVIYRDNPSEDQYFNALNGDVNITVKKGFKGDIYFKSMNGDFYTSIDQNLVKSHTVTEKEVRSDRSGKSGKTEKAFRKLKVKLHDRERLTIRNGGPDLHFSLLNGDVNLEESNAIN